MKKILLTLVLLVGIIFGLFAQNLTYQAVVRDNNQQLVVNTDVKATVTIDFATGEDPTWTVDATTNLHGLLSIEFGDETLKGRDWTGATIAVKVVNAATPSTVYVNDDARPVSAVPYALSVDGQSIQNYLTANNYVDLVKLNDTLSAYPTTAVMDGRHYLRSDSAVITTMQSDIAELKAGQFDCNKVKDCIKDTLEKYTPTTDLCNVLNDCQFSGKTLDGLLQELTNQISDLKEQVDSLSNLSHGGGTTEVADGQPCPGAQTVKDFDGNTYNTVKIGSQCWTKENMKTTKYANGTDIDNSKMFNPGGSEDNVATYGKLYTWSAATRDSSTTYPTSGDKVQGICPAGWHVPSDAEWTALTDYVNTEANGFRCNGDGTIANALSSLTGWQSPSECAAGHSSATVNKTGFSAVPAGYCFSGYFNDFGYSAYFWSATQGEDDIDNAWRQYLNCYVTLVYRGIDSKANGFSVRCLRDAGIGGATPSTPATMSCDDVMRCMGDTLGKLIARIESQGAQIETLTGTVTEQGETITTQGQTITTQGNTIESLAYIVDSLSKLPHGGGDTPTEVADGQPCPGAPTVTDIDNNEYPTVKIGSQCWMAQNLRTNVGDGVYPKKNSGTEELDAAEQIIYGRLYTWNAMMNSATSSNNVPSGVQGICPAGWHVPSNAEWDTLTCYVFNSTSPDYKCGSSCSSWAAQSDVSCIAKALASKTGWDTNETNCNVGNTPENNDATGFAAVPAGMCYHSDFGNFGGRASFWTATQDASNKAWLRNLYNFGSSVYINNNLKDYCLSVRCLRNAE